MRLREKREKPSSKQPGASGSLPLAPHVSRELSPAQIQIHRATPTKSRAGNHASLSPEKTQSGMFDAKMLNPGYIWIIMKKGVKALNMMGIGPILPVANSHEFIMSLMVVGMFL